MPVTRSLHGEGYLPYHPTLNNNNMVTVTCRIKNKTTTIWWRLPAVSRTKQQQYGNDYLPYHTTKQQQYGEDYLPYQEQNNINHYSKNNINLVIYRTNKTKNNFELQV